MEKYDFALSWDKNPCLFTDTLEASSGKKGLSFLRVDENNLRSVIKGLENGRIAVRLFLDTEATYDVPDNLYARLCYAVKDSGGTVINDPDRARIAVDKAVMYYELVDASIRTPYTVVVRNWEPKKFKLTAAEKERLGTPFVIKPGCGYGHMGIIHNARGTVREIAEARDFDPGDNFLLQEKIHPAELGGKRAWFRVFHLFDKIIPCWWDDRHSRYEHVTGEEFEQYNLSPLVRMTARIGGLSRMVWFSTEIAIEKKDGRQKFTVIDYVNDQCDMEARRESEVGVPDRIVRMTAYTMVHKAKELKRAVKRYPGRYTVLLRNKGGFGIHGLGCAPDLLTQREHSLNL